MYTRCPNCKAAIGFDLPDGHDGDRFKVRCPQCGKTLEVDLTRPSAEQTSAVGACGESEAAAVARQKAEKRRRIIAVIKNVVMIVPSLVFIALNIACYCSIKGVFGGGNEFNSFYNGIYLWELIFTERAYFELSFSIDPNWAFAELIPLILFTLSCANVVVLIVGACCKKYGKTYNIVFGTFACALAVAVLFLPYVNFSSVAKFAGKQFDMTIGEYFRYIVNPQYTTVFISPVAGILHLVLSIALAALPAKRARGGKKA